MLQLRSKRAANFSIASAALTASTLRRLSIMLPGSGMMMRMTYGIPGSAPTRHEDAPTAMVVEASDGYFKAMGIPIIAGQDFTAARHRGQSRRGRERIISRARIIRDAMPWANKCSWGRNHQTSSRW